MQDKSDPAIHFRGGADWRPQSIAFSGERGLPWPWRWLLLFACVAVHALVLALLSRTEHFFPTSEPEALVTPIQFIERSASLDEAGVRHSDAVKIPKALRKQKAPQIAAARDAAADPKPALILSLSEDEWALAPAATEKQAPPADLLRYRAPILSGRAEAIVPGFHVRPSLSPEQKVAIIGAFLFGGGKVDPCPEIAWHLANNDGSVDVDEELRKRERYCRP